MFQRWALWTRDSLSLKLSSCCNLLWIPGIYRNSRTDPGSTHHTVLSCVDVWNPWLWQLHHILFSVFRGISKMWSTPERFLYIEIFKNSSSIESKPKVPLESRLHKRKITSQHIAQNLWIMAPVTVVWFTYVPVLENHNFYIILSHFQVFPHFKLPLWHFMPVFEWHVGPHFIKLNLILFIIPMFILLLFPAHTNCSIPASF